MVQGTIKWPSDRLFKEGTRRKLVFNTPQGEITVWGNADDPVFQTAVKGQQFNLEQNGRFWNIVQGHPAQYTTPSGGGYNNGHTNGHHATPQNHTNSAASLLEMTDIYLKIYGHLKASQEMTATQDDIIQKSACTIFIKYMDNK